MIRENSGRANGCTLDRQGRLVVCEAGTRRVTRTEPDGSITAIAEHWDGRRLNRPNDVVCRSDGTIYFTDPGLFVAPHQRELGFSAVFGVDPQGRVLLATDECEYPNGLAFSPDESVLYVAISRLDERCVIEAARGEVCRHRLIRAFDVARHGTLSHNRVFADLSSAEPGVPDGLKVDTEGRVYCAGSGGVWVVDHVGDRIGVIRFPELARNLAFGGAHMSTMYVTAGDSLYALETKVRGIGAF